MKFQKTLQELCINAYKGYYICYKDLKKAIKVITGQDTSSYTIKEVTESFGNIRALGGSIYRPAESRFQDLLNHELQKINKFVSMTANAILVALRTALNGARDSSDVDLEYVGNLEAELDAQAEEMGNLFAFINLNFTGFRKITKKYDKQSKSNASSWFMCRLGKEEFMNVDFDYMLALLSVCYEEWRALDAALKEADATSLSTTPNPPLSGGQEGSVMRSTKYWISPTELVKVKVKAVKHVPLMTIDGLSCRDDSVMDFLMSDRKQHGKATHGTSMWKSENHTIYVDTSEFAEYDRLIKVKECGQSIIRFRWCGENNGAADIPILAEEVFHDERASDSREWPNELRGVMEAGKASPTVTLPSSSALLRQGQMQTLMNGTLDIQAWKPLVTADEAKQRETLKKIKTEITTKKLFPRLRSTFNRTFYKNSDAVVIFDETIRFSREEHVSASNSTWLRDIESPPDISAFPYGVIDVHLSKNSSGQTQSLWLSELTGLAGVTEVFGYSPFLHGTACVHVGQLRSVPQWYQFAAMGAEHEQQTSSEPLPPHKKAEKIDVLRKGTTARLLHEHESSPPEFASEFEEANAGDVEASCPAAPLPPPPEEGHYGLNYHLSEPLLPPDAGDGHRGIDEGDEGMYARRRQSNIFTRIWRAILPRRPRVSALLAGQTVNPHPSSVVRVEPKTFFANERTLLQWMNTAVLLSTIAITLLNFGTDSSRLAGLIMSPVAIFFIVYAFMTFLRRSKALEHKEPINYNDRTGPTALVVTLVSALSAMIVLNIMYGGRIKLH